MKLFTFHLKKVLFLFAMINISTLAVLANPIEISDRAGLEAISSDLAGSYILTVDIDLTGADWVPLGTDSSPFTGTLDGNGHYLIGLHFDKTDNDGTVYPDGSRKMGLFSSISGGTVKKLGIKNAYVKGGKHVGVIAGSLKNAAVVEECAVLNSYIETGDHGGSIAGNMEGQSIVRNCYANGEVYSRDSQGNGLVGMYKDNGTTISKSYYSGIVRSGNPSAIGAWNDGGNPTSEYNVGLAPYVLGGSNLRVTVGNNSTMRGLYALSSSILSGGKDDFGAINTITNIKDSNYGSDKRHGAHIPGGDANSLSQEFYEETLEWDFDNIWKMPTHGYPVLQWQVDATTDVSIVAVSTLKRTLYPNGNKVDLYKYVYVSNTWQGAASDVIDFTTDSEDVVIVDGQANLSATGLTKTGTYDVTINIVAKSGYNLVGSKTSFTIQLKPEFHEISSIGDLATITDVEAAYKLTADLDFEGIPFTRMDEFKGVLNGNGHIIKNISYSAPTDSDDGKNVGLFKTIRDAHIYDLGLENINFNGWNDVAGIAGQAYGKSLIENCYVSNSYIEGRDHVASIVGALRDGSTIKNCYSNASVHSREHQAGGISGVMNFGFIYNSYYSGRISNQNNRAVGIGGYQDNGGQAAANIRIENSVSLAPFLLSNSWTNDAIRILHDNGDRPYTLINNYGLATAWRGKNDFSDGGLVSEDTGRIGTDKLQGENVTQAVAVTQAFYETTLGWDFDNIWTMLDDGYPVFKWQTTPVSASIVYQADQYDLEKDNEEWVDLTTIVPNTHGLTYTVISDDEDKVEVDGSKVRIASAWNESVSKQVDVTISVDNVLDFDIAPTEVTFNLLPSSKLSDLQINGTTIDGFNSSKYQYELYVDDATIDISATPINLSNTFGEGEIGTQVLKIGQNELTVTVITAGGFERAYNLTVHRGIFSVMPDIHGTGKRRVNVHSGTTNNSKENPYKLLIGKQAVPESGFGDYKWCPSANEDREPYVIFSFADIYRVGAVAFRDKNFREAGNQQVDKWKVEVSMDLEDWTTVVDVDGQTDITYKYEEFEMTLARYLKFTPTKKDGANAAWVYGFDIYGEYDSPYDGFDDSVISRGKTILSYDGEYNEGHGRETPANILDGNHDGNPWATYNYPMSVDIDLEDLYYVGGFKLISDQQTNNLIRGYKVYLKENLGDEWSTPYDITNISTDIGIQSGEHILSAAVSARYVKLEIPTEYKQESEERKDAWTRLREFEVFDSKVITSLSKEILNEDIKIKTLNNLISVEINGDISGTVKVYNIVGHQLLSQELSSQTNIINKNFESGIYIVSVENNGNSKTQKLVIR